MRFSEFLTERVLNLIKPEDKLKHIDVVSDIIHSSYASIGGFKNISDKDDLKHELERMAQNKGIWKLVKRGDDIVSASLYKQTPMGRKGLATGAIKDPRGKEGVYQVKKDDVRTGRAYVEVSGKMEHIMIKKFGAKPIPAEHAQKILGKDVQPSEDGFHYTRELGGHQHEKILVGRLDDSAWDYVQSHQEDTLVIDKAA